MRIVINNIKLKPSSTGNVRASASVSLFTADGAEIRLKTCRIVALPDEKPFLGLPGMFGGGGFRETIELSQSLHEQLEESVLAAWSSKLERKARAAMKTPIVRGTV